MVRPALGTCQHRPRLRPDDTVNRDPGSGLQIPDGRVGQRAELAVKAYAQLPGVANHVAAGQQQALNCADYRARIALPDYRHSCYPICDGGRGRGRGSAWLPPGQQRARTEAVDILAIAARCGVQGPRRPDPLVDRRGGHDGTAADALVIYGVLPPDVIRPDGRQLVDQPAWPVATSARLVFAQRGPVGRVIGLDGAQLVGLHLKITQGHQDRQAARGAEFVQPQPDIAAVLLACHGTAQRPVGHCLPDDTHTQADAAQLGCLSSCQILRRVVGQVAEYRRVTGSPDGSRVRVLPGVVNCQLVVHDCGPAGGVGARVSVPACRAARNAAAAGRATNQLSCP